MAFYDYYKILGVPHAAQPDDIKQSFKQLAMKYHPDRNPDNPQAEEIFKLIVHAYEHLSDAEKKKEYDLKLLFAFSQAQKDARQSAEQEQVNRKKYGISRRMRKTHQQDMAEQIAYYENRIARFSFWQRLGFISLCAFAAWMCVCVDKYNFIQFVFIHFYSYSYALNLSTFIRWLSFYFLLLSFSIDGKT